MTNFGGMLIDTCAESDIAHLFFGNKLVELRQQAFVKDVYDKLLALNSCSHATVKTQFAAAKVELLKLAEEFIAGCADRVEWTMNNLMLI